MATVAEGINNQGDIVLDWLDSAGNIESSLYNGKTYKTINVPNAVQSFAHDINKAGDIAYQWFSNDFSGHGALFHKGKYYTFDCSNSMGTAANGLNDENRIVGFCEPNNNYEGGFVATY
jgi:uncharacterized membrane protein